MTVGDSANIAAAFAGALSAFFAFLTIRKSVNERRDDRMLSYAVKTLERAYESLVGNPRSVPPPADRLAWLTTARLLEDYKRAKVRIRDKVALEELEGHEEHWRHQFYLALLPLERCQPGFYSGSANSRHLDQIPKITAIIIHAFASWPEDKVDPLDAYKNQQDAVDRLGVSKMWIGLRHYLNIL
ncbi:hypothetical protein [Pseudomonas sp. SDO5591_S426]